MDVDFVSKAFEFCPLLQTREADRSLSNLPAQRTSLHTPTASRLSLISRNVLQLPM